MLSRLVQAQLGRTGARLASAPVFRTTTARVAAPAALAASPWPRAYSSNTNRPGNNKPRPSSQKHQSSEQPDTQASSQEPDAQKSTETPAESEPIPFHKLPDLTQGIPSTLEAELEKQSGRAEVSSALQTVEQGSRGGGRDREEYVPTSERNRKWWARFMLSVTGVGATTAIAYMGRNWENQQEVAAHPDEPNGWGPLLWWQRVRARMNDSVSYYQDPAFDKLLPDPDPSFERPYTLCISLDNLLVHSEWSRQHGWRVAKRPGMDYFIRYLSQYYELVLFTSVPFATGEPLVRKLDPFRFIMWPLYREATKFEEGEIVKDLSYLNRDLSKVIIIDSNPRSVRKQPENAIVLEPWKGDPSDKELVGLIPFLEYIHTMQYADVRKILKSFEGKNIPVEFARREAIARKEFNARVQAEKSKHHRPSGMGALGNLLGLDTKNMSMTVSPDGEVNPAEAFAQGKMLQDIARERGQRNYEMMEKEIRANGEKWLKEEQVAMEKAQKEAMDSMFGGFSGWFVPSQQQQKEDQDKDKKA